MKRVSVLLGVLMVVSTSVIAMPDPQETQVSDLQKEIDALKSEVDQLKKQQATQVNSPHSIQENNKPTEDVGETYTKGVAITTSPFLGLRSAYDASDLIVNLSTMNEDLRLLEQRQKLTADLKDRDLKYPPRALVELSGGLEGQTIFEDPYAGSGKSDIDLTRAEFDILSQISSWVNGFLSFAYNGASPDTGARVTNSAVFLNRGFITIGNLDKTPFYFSMGQMYVPFGRYASNILSTPITLSIARTNQRALLLGYSEQGIYASMYGFKGDTTMGQSSVINEGGVNTGYKYALDNLSAEMGAGLISNIADSQGMQDTEGSGFPGFAKPPTGSSKSSQESLTHRVPAADLHTELGFGKYGLNLEYVGSVRNFDATDLSFNNSSSTLRGAKPQALHTELSYSFDVKDRPTTAALAYDQSWEALALNVPQSSYIAVLNTSILEHTIESVEFRHDENYHSKEVAGGNNTRPTAPTGSTRNTFLTQLGVYF